jgi:hypothetical protein
MNQGKWPKLSMIANTVELSDIDPFSFLPDNLNTPVFFINNMRRIHVVDVIRSMQAKN